MKIHIKVIVGFCSLILFSSLANAEKVDATSFDCAFTIGKAKQTQRHFDLNEDVYRCLRHKNYSDMVLINGQGRAVWYKLSKIPDQIDQRKFSKKLEYFSESSQDAFKTAAQIRRIGKLTGVISGQENDDQWRRKNAYYSSFIIDQLSESNIDLELENQFKHLKYLTINTDIPLLAGGRFSVESILIMIETSKDLRNWQSLLEPIDLSFLSREAGTDPQTIKIPKHSGERYLRIAIMSHQKEFTKNINSITAEYVETQRQATKLNWLKTEQAEWNEEQQFWQVKLPLLVPISSIRFTHSSEVAYYQGSLNYLQYFDPMSIKQQQSIPVESGKDKLKRITKKALRHNHKQSRQSDWRRLGRFNQYLLRTDEGVEKSPDISTGWVFSKQWGFAFKRPEDISELELPKIEFAWHPQQLVFAAQGKGPFTLLVGRDEPISWDNIPILPKLLDSDGEEVTLVKFGGSDSLKSTQSLDNAYSSIEVSTKRKPVSWFKVMLFLLLGLGVLLLTYMALRLSKSMNS